MTISEQVEYKGNREEVFENLSNYMNGLYGLNYLKLLVSFNLDGDKEKVFEGFYDTDVINVIGKNNYKAYFNDLKGVENITGKNLEINVSIKNYDFIPHLDELLIPKTINFMGKLSYLDGDKYFNDGCDSYPLALVDEHVLMFNDDNESIENVQIITETIKGTNFKYAKVEYAPLTDVITKGEVEFIYGKTSIEYVDSDNCEQFLIASEPLSTFLKLGESYFVKITLYK